MNRLLIKIYLRRPPYGVLQFKIPRYTLRFNYIEKPEELILRLKALAAGTEYEAAPKSCFILKGKTAVSGVFHYKLVDGMVTLHIIGNGFWWKGTLQEFKRAIRFL